MVLNTGLLLSNDQQICMLPHLHTHTQFEYEVTGSAVTVKTDSDIINSVQAKIVLVGVAKTVP